MIKEEGKLIYVKDGEFKEAKVLQIHSDSIFFEIVAIIDGEIVDLFYFAGQNVWVYINRYFGGEYGEYLPYDKYEIKKVILTTTIE